MKRKFKIPFRYIVIATVFFAIIPVVIFPDRYLSSVSAGLNLFVLNVFPAMFPFFFFSTILANLNFGYDLGLVVKKPLKKLYNAPPLAGYVFVMSMLCGYPIGAKILSDFYSKNLINEKEAKQIASFTSTSSPLFIVGTVGTTMLQAKNIGFIILISHYLSSILNGFLFRPRKINKNEFSLTPIQKSDAVLKDSMTSALFSVAIVGGFIIIFNLILAILEDVGLIDLLCKPLAGFVDIELAKGLISGLIEITKGCLMVSQSGRSLKITAPVCAFIITNGGLSITMQSLTFLSYCKISPAYYLLYKTTQGILCFAICFGLCALIL